MKPKDFNSEEERAIVEAEQIKAFFLETNDQNIAGVMVMSLLVYVVHQGIPTWTWLPALALLYLNSALRGWLIWQYHRTPKRYSTTQWGLGQTITGGFSGICWGAANTAMLAHVSTEHQLLIMTVITVSAASNAAEGFSFPSPSRAFILLSLCPPIVWLLSTDNPIHQILASMLILFIPLTLWQSEKRNRVFIDAQKLRFRNESLARELAKQCSLAEQASLSKGRFLAAASHDLRQPMQALSIFHELLGAELESSSRVSELLNNARKAAGAMNTLLDALLNISKLDANVVKPECRIFSAQELLDEIDRDFRPIARQAGIHFRVMPCSAMVVSDRVLCTQIMRNLVSNALRYAPDGHVLVGCRRHHEHITFGVYDTGIGIAPEQQTAIFGEFYQVANHARDRQHGIGLGLSIVERIARLLGHPVSLTSEPGRGSCFTVSIPLASPADRLRLSCSEKEVLPETRKLTGLRVLVVEDEAPIRLGLEQLLAGWGCAVETASSADEAILRAETQPIRFDVVISDMSLPGSRNGIDLITCLRARSAENLPALLVTGDTSQATLQAAKHANLIMLHKPVKPARLRSALSALTRQQP